MTFRELEEGEEEIMCRVQVQVARARAKADPSRRKDVKFLMTEAAVQDFRVTYGAQGNFVTCVLERQLNKRSWGYFVGVAKRNPSDGFSKHNGERLALRRAFERVGHTPPLRCKP